MSQVVNIAALTLKEASRRKLLLALLVLTALVIGATVWGFSRLPGIVLSEGPGLPRHPISSAEVRLATSQLLILVMFTYSFVLALSAALTAAPAISSELESGVALAILTRPISRLQVLLGKWVGLAVLIVVYVGFASLSEFLLVDFVTGYFPPDPLGFIAYMAAETLVLMTLALLLSTRLPAMTGGVIVLGAFGVSWMGGIASAAGNALQNQAIINAGTLVKLLIPSDGLWHGAVFSLEPRAVLAAVAGEGRAAVATNPFFSTSPPPASFLLWSAAWTAVILLLSTLSFQRREV